jgi:hypothetical protein
MKSINSINKVFTYSEMIDLNVPYVIQNRTTRFIPAAAMAIGALGTF